MKPHRNLLVGGAFIILAVAVITLMARWAINKPLILILP
jgi:hypothetical protein